MQELYDIVGHWNIGVSNVYNEIDMWKGQFVLYKDGWCEGIVNDPNSGYSKDMFVFGVYFEDKTIQLVKCAPIEDSDPFIFNCNKDSDAYDGSFTFVDGLHCGRSYINVTKAKKQENIDQLNNKINNFKNTMGEELERLYDISIEKRTDIYNKINNEDINEEYEKELPEIEEKREVGYKRVRSSDDDLPF